MESAFQFKLFVRSIAGQNRRALPQHAEAYNISPYQRKLRCISVSVLSRTPQNPSRQRVCLQRKWESEEQGGKLQFRGRVHPQQGLDCRSRGAPLGLGLAGRGAAEAV